MAGWWKGAPLALAVALFGAMSSAGPAQADQAQVKRGAYLARIMDCGGCHTPEAMTGKPDMEHALSGGTVGFQVSNLGVFYPPNLTSDKETGLGGWSAAQIETALRTGVRPDGRELAPIMPWRSYSALQPADMAALIAFLQSLPPVRHQVPGPVAVGAAAPLPYLAAVVPQ